MKKTATTTTTTTQTAPKAAPKAAPSPAPVANPVAVAVAAAEEVMSGMHGYNLAAFVAGGVDSPELAAAVYDYETAARKYADAYKALMAADKGKPAADAKPEAVKAWEDMKTAAAAEAADAKAAAMKAEADAEALAWEALPMDGTATALALWHWYERQLSKEKRNAAAALYQRPELADVMDDENIINLLKEYGCVSCSVSAYDYAEVFDIPMSKVQRGDVWSDAQIGSLWDSIRRGYHIPAVTIVYRTDIGEFHIADGRQRRFALRSILGECDPANPDDMRVIDALRRYTMTADVVPAASHEEEGVIFQRLNNGKPLTAAEKAVASLDEERTEAVEPWKALARSYVGSLANAEGKFGRMSADGLGICLAAAAVDACDKKHAGTATTNAGTAAAALGAAENIPTPDDFPAANEVLTVLAAGGWQNPPKSIAWWSSAARIVPAVLATADKKAAPDEVRTMVETWEPKAGGGSFSVSKRTTKNEADLWSTGANSAGYVAARRRNLAKVMEAARKAAAKAAKASKGGGVGSKLDNLADNARQAEEEKAEAALSKVDGLEE